MNPFDQPEEMWAEPSDEDRRQWAIEDAAQDAEAEAAYEQHVGANYKPGHSSDIPF